MILPNTLTVIGVCIGLSSIKFALDSKFELSVIAIIFAALFDALDGRVARLIKGTSKVGKELDSLTDVISFGVAPAFIMYFWNLNNLGKFGWLLCLIYVVCVALRLARFNINSNVDEVIDWADALNVLRIQRERMGIGIIPSIREYRDYFGITKERLDRSNKKTLKIKQKIISHMKIKVPTFNKNKLPSKIKSIPISKPGSRHVK